MRYYIVKTDKVGGRGEGEEGEGGREGADTQTTTTGLE